MKPLRSLPILVLIALLAPGCGASSASPPGSDGVEPPERELTDAGPGCGLSFDAAVEANPGERVCQTTVYDEVTGYCTHWVACSSLY